MKTISLLFTIMFLLTMIFGCGEASKPSAEWKKSKKIAGKEQQLSHISGLAVDDKFVYVTSGGNLADQQEGTSGLRKIALDSGAATVLDDGKTDLPQSDNGGIALDEKYIYWNAGGKIRRIGKDGGKSEIVAAENVGIGIDLAVDDEKIYWTNHQYYSPNIPIKPSPIYKASKQDGKPSVFVDQQYVPGNLIIDDKYVYWNTASGIFKQAKSGGQMQTVFQAADKEGVDELRGDAENLYFAFRAAGDSRWAIRKISKNGGEPQTLVKSFSLKPFVVDDTNVYFFDEGGRAKDDLCKISKNGGEVSKLDNGYAGGVITQSKTLVYFASLDDIYSFNK